MSEMIDTEFDFNDAVEDIMNGKNISGKDGILGPGEENELFTYGILYLGARDKS